ncbi:hypothetical protein ACFX12_045291 [Malus domestica]
MSELLSSKSGILNLIKTVSLTMLFMQVMANMGCEMIEPFSSGLVSFGDAMAVACAAGAERPLTKKGGGSGSLCLRLWRQRKVWENGAERRRK